MKLHGLIAFSLTAPLLLVACSDADMPSANPSGQRVDRPSGNAAFTPDAADFVILAQGEVPPPQFGSSTLSVSAEAVDEAIQRGNDQRDPRFYGYAEGMIRKLLEQEPGNTAYLLRFADLLQKQHAFDESASAYKQVIDVDPSSPQAYLSLAMLARQRGDLAGMEGYCKQLMGRTHPSVVAICLHSSQALQGKLEKSFNGMQALLQRPMPAQIQVWALQETAEMAARLNRAKVAQSLWQAALAAADTPVPPAELLAAVADFHHQQQQASVVVTLLEGESETPALAMRLARAELSVAADEAARQAIRARWVDALQPWLDTTRLRDEIHHGDLALYYSAVAGEPAQALPHAFEQWSQRKEPQDTLLLLEVISQLGEDSDAALQSLQAVEAWLKQTGYEDRRLPTVQKVNS